MKCVLFVGRTGGWCGVGLLSAVEFVVDDVGHHLSDVESGGAYLLRYETCGGHSGCGVYFEQVDSARWFDDVIDPNDAFGIDGGVDFACFVLNGFSPFVGYACRRYFLYLAVIFGVVVEKFVVGNHFGDGENDLFVACAIHAAGYFGACHQGFDHHFGAFGKGFFDGRHNVRHVFDFGNAETAAAIAWFDEAGQPDFFDDVNYFDGVVAVQPYGFGDIDAETFQILVARIFVECERCCQHVAARERDSHQAEIALQDAVFAGCREW